MISRCFSSIRADPITITQAAWIKINDVLKHKESFAFLFSATGGGCNGFNYNLETIDKDKFDEFHKTKIPPSVVTNQNSKIIIDPISEMLLIGTTIDYIKEDYSNNIFENKFTFTPKKDFATTCGCGSSFTPRDF